MTTDELIAQCGRIEFLTEKEVIECLRHKNDSPWFPKPDAKLKARLIEVRAEATIERRHQQNIKATYRGIYAALAAAAASVIVSIFAASYARREAHAAEAQVRIAIRAMNAQVEVWNAAKPLPETPAPKATSEKSPHESNGKPETTVEPSKPIEQFPQKTEGPPAPESKANLR
ncbi:MAG: hypothetical protein U0984_19925 [Prosthecobacter sp.]|nr:hypothetical protein [Prosthecobacter sp.]